MKKDYKRIPVQLLEKKKFEKIAFSVNGLKAVDCSVSSLTKMVDGSTAYLTKELGPVFTSIAHSRKYSRFLIAKAKDGFYLIDDAGFSGNSPDLELLNYCEKAGIEIPRKVDKALRYYLTR